jgi:hypothetical protein
MENLRREEMGSLRRRRTTTVRETGSAAAIPRHPPPWETAMVRATATAMVSVRASAPPAPTTDGASRSTPRATRVLI